MQSLVWAIFGLFVNTAYAKCLVLSDSVEKFSQLLKSLNCDVQKSISDPSVHLEEYGQFLFEDLAILVTDPAAFRLREFREVEGFDEAAGGYRPTAAELQNAHMLVQRQHDNAHGRGDGLSMRDVLDFVDSGRNVFVAVNGGRKSPSNDLVNLLSELGFAIADKLLVGNSEETSSMVGGIGPSGVVAFEGAAIGLSSNPNVFSILRSERGADIVGVHQTLNGARILVSGSLGMFENGTILKNKFNQKWMAQVVSWAFGRRALLRMRDFYHHRVGQATGAPKMYREKDQIVVGFRIEELKESGLWAPYIAKDVQIEYVMLDPHVRQFMEVTEAGEYRLEFKVPDVYGIFKFRLDYHRKGYNQLFFEQVAPVRNFKHNDYDRFLFCAYPYYASCFISLALVVVFCFLFANHKDRGWKAPEKELRHRE